MGGYLKQTAPRPDSGRVFYTLSVPNEEVKTTYQKIIRRFFTARVEPERVEIMLKAIVLAVFSYHDFRGEPEKVYHALVMGLLVRISGTHEIKSNRESGFCTHRPWAPGLSRNYRSKAKNLPKRYTIWYNM